MTHVKRFQGIPMSKSMRGICKEEDYVFLGGKETLDEDEIHENPNCPNVHTSDSEDWRSRKEERVRRRMEREQQERERLREIEERKMEKEQQWRCHVAELTSTQEPNVKDRLVRLRRFRAFQRRVLKEECEGMEPNTTGLGKAAH